MTDEKASRTLKAVIKVKVIKVIKHFPLALFSYSIILNINFIFNIILYIYSVPPESLMTLMTLTLMTGKRENFLFLFFYVK